MAHGSRWSKVWTWLEPWLENLVWMNPDAAGAYLAWQLSQRVPRVPEREVLKVA